MLLLLVIVASVGGCGATGAGGAAQTLAGLQALRDECDGPVSAYEAFDESQTGRGDTALVEERLKAARGLAEQVAACGGRMKVVAFSSSAAETQTLGEAEFPTSSGTENARLLAGQRSADSLLGEVEDSLPTALRALNPNGSDILAQLELGREFAEQGTDGRLYLEIDSDGIATTKPVRLNSPQFTLKVARREALALSLPDLSGASVRFLGIGKSSGDHQLSSTRIAAIKSFYRLVCQRTGAECLLATEYSKGVQ